MLRLCGKLVHDGTRRGIKGVQIFTTTHNTDLTSRKCIRQVHLMADKDYKVFIVEGEAREPQLWRTCVKHTTKLLEQEECKMQS